MKISKVNYGPNYMIRYLNHVMNGYPEGNISNWKGSLLGILVTEGTAYR